MMTGLYICTVALLKSCTTRVTVSARAGILVAYHCGVTALPGGLDSLICRSREGSHYHEFSERARRREWKSPRRIDGLDSSTNVDPVRPTLGQTSWPTERTSFPKVLIRT